MMVDGLEQLRVRGQHGRRSARARRTRTTTPSTPRRRCWRSEAQAQRVIDPLAGRFWKIVNPSVRKRLGEPVAYKLMPGDNVLPFAGPEASVTKRAAFMTRHLWVTRHDPRERYAAGEYPNQHPGGAGLPGYVQDDAPLENTDVVALVHLRRAPRRPARGLAGDAGDHDRLHAQARRLLRPQPRPGRAAPDGAWRVLRASSRSRARARDLAIMRP